MKKSSSLQFLTRNMSSIHDSPHTAPIANKIQMDIDSDLEAEQVAREFTQAHEQLRISNEAWERCQVEQKQKEEEEKVKITAAFKLVVEQAAELVVDREQRIILQVSFGFHHFGTGS